ncbi:MAG: hypothetical protein KHZ99_06045 [Clostridium sp.]|uniref:hypothetical protein n=1 Tax=Clostridium sp. TaxID=1506 RepID=UPI0025BE064E|nr:hypothetical protein [Clostridium sp.]MBS4956592.1 hypothetical protein [Clostridium sp.]
MGKVIEFPIISDKQIEEIEKRYCIDFNMFIVALNYKDNEQEYKAYKLYIKYNFIEGTEIDRAIATAGLINSYRVALGNSNKKLI